MIQNDSMFTKVQAGEPERARLLTGFVEARNRELPAKNLPDKQQPRTANSSQRMET
jgi:hypothetical protein